nr:cytochrome d ubiquinol oxidase subunit II [Hydrogenivirga sp. 128-5-R1-1]
MFTTLNGIWFLLAGIFLIGYSLTDGFDLGSGILHIFAKDENTRITYMNAVGPVWDGMKSGLLLEEYAFRSLSCCVCCIFQCFYLQCYSFMGINT